MNLHTVTRNAPALRDVERWLRAVAPRSSPPPSNLPRLLAAVALLSVGALAALLLSPKNGSEMRSLARERVAGLRRRARDFASRESRAAGGGRASQPESQRSRRTEATS
jgi:hypothetical protein